jgi:hypothetical protein
MENPNDGKAEYAVKTTWDGQLRAITRPEPFVLGVEVHARPFGGRCGRTRAAALEQPSQDGFG